MVLIVDKKTETNIKKIFVTGQEIERGGKMKRIKCTEKGTKEKVENWRGSN